MRTTNPVLTRFPAAPAALRQPTGAWGAGPRPAPATPAAPAGRADVMTIDDVAVKTGVLVGTTAVTAAATWALVPDAVLGVAWIAAAVLGLVLGMVIAFARVANPALVVTYAVVEGVLLGAVSKVFEARYQGIVLQAVVATLGTFLVMAVLYQARIVRATPRFMKIVMGMAIGLVVVMGINALITVFSDAPTVLRDGGPLAVAFSLVCIVVAALMFVVNFRQIEDGIAAGLPRRAAWLGAFGILVELVWLYLEFLQLISYFSED